MGSNSLVYPTVNGNRYSWASIEIQIAGTPYRGVKGVDYKDAIERIKQWGTGRRPLGRTAGKYDPDGSLEVFKEEAVYIRSALAALSGAGWGEAAFQIVISYDEKNIGNVTDKLLNCMVIDVSDSHSQSADGITEKWTLSVIDITRNGLSMLSNTAT
jgi:hypothetical protein